LYHAKVEGDKSINPAESPNYWVNATELFGGLYSLSTSGLLSVSLTSGRRKKQIIELDDRRLTLCHAKVGGKH